MNKEIKAFLVDIKDNEEWKEIYNYITNLQQENEIRQQDINNLTYQLAQMKQENKNLRTRIKTIKRLRKKQTQKKNKYKSIIFDEEQKLKELKEENERLKDELETMTFTAKVKQEAVDNLISRIDKAEEHIKKNVCIDYYGVAIFRKQEDVDILLNILQNGSDDNE